MEWIMKNSGKPGKEVKIYSLIIQKTPQKFMKGLDDRIFNRIDEKIMSLKSNPFPRNSKKLFVFDC
jgi:hypothetical protein